MAEIRHLEDRHDVIFFCWGWSDLDKISQTGAEWHVDCGDVVEIETRCRIPIWRTFGRIPWHFIPEPPATLQSAVTWRNQCHDRATLQGVIISSAKLKTVFRHILFFFVFLMQFGLWRAAAFVSSPIHLFHYLSYSLFVTTSCFTRIRGQQIFLQFFLHLIVFWGELGTFGTHRRQKKAPRIKHWRWGGKLCMRLGL